MGQTVGWALNVQDFIFPQIKTSYNEDHDNLVFFPSGADTDIPAMLILPSDLLHRKIDQGYTGKLGERARACVIYFHPNAVDIGDCIPDMYRIQNHVFKGDAAVLAPEYCGYGMLSEYRPTVESIDLVANATWRYCRKKLGFSADQIIFWGRSIGTGPACSMASWRAGRKRGNKARRKVGGVVLIAPFTAISDVALWHTNSVIASLVGPMWEVSELVKDDGLQDVPFCVVHPREDEVIPFSQGQAVFENSASKLKLSMWVDNATHNFALEDEHLLALHSFLFEHFRQQPKRRATCPAKKASSVNEAFDFEDMPQSQRSSMPSMRHCITEGNDAEEASDFSPGLPPKKESRVVFERRDEGSTVASTAEQGSPGSPTSSAHTQMAEALAEDNESAMVLDAEQQRHRSSTATTQASSNDTSVIIGTDANTATCEKDPEWTHQPDPVPSYAYVPRAVRRHGSDP